MGDVAAAIQTFERCVEMIDAPRIYRRTSAAGVGRVIRSDPRELIVVASSTLSATE